MTIFSFHDLKKELLLVLCLNALKKSLPECSKEIFA